MTTEKQFIPLNVAILTISDSRIEETDSTGDLLVHSLASDGHTLMQRTILPNNKYQIRAQVSSWIASESIQVVLVNGGTGFANGNCTVQALTPLFDQHVTGFGELFRQLSFLEIGSSSMQSRAVAGLANGTLIFAMPGSGGGARLAWQQLIKPQLDAQQGPCNFVAHLKKLQ
ncbi:molybdenum cofactor biosynthesis protein B [Aliidiomarina sp.]|uniref:molybdenum cofactor biosynthesis protein B n=1 Tax=Aliidiomarina sp. TaxID=1872439 RepID=UPI003A4D6247